MKKGLFYAILKLFLIKTSGLLSLKKLSKDIFLDEITKYLPFYKVSAELLGYKVIGFVKKKDQAMLPNEHLILSSDIATLSILIDVDNDYLNGNDALSMDHWCINRKIMGDHQIQLEETGKYRPHELGQQNTRVSFNKGCFKGQEIIARMEYLGKLKKETRLIVHSNKKEVSKFTIIGQSYQDQEKFFHLALEK